MSLLSPKCQIVRVLSDIEHGFPFMLYDASTSALCITTEFVTKNDLENLRAVGSASASGGLYVVITTNRMHSLANQILACGAAYSQALAQASANNGKLDLSSPIVLRLPYDTSPADIQQLVNPISALEAPYFKGWENIEITIPTDELCAILKEALRMTYQCMVLPSLLFVPLQNDEKNLPCSFLKEKETLNSLHIETFRKAPADSWNFVCDTQVMLGLGGNTQLHLFRSDMDPRTTLCAIVIGSISEKGVLCRLHSSCFTGDTLTSMHCDCRQQLELSLGKLASEGAGILLYLTQEGRGIGLSNKIRTYRLQNLYKLDTVEANEALGFENDHRIFSGAAQVLNFMGIRSVRLLTNNPLKSKQLEEFGILVDSFCPLIAERNAKNTHYLSTKAKKSNHSL